MGQLVVDRYVTHFGGASSDDHVAMSLSRLGAGAPLKTLVEDLTAALLRVVKDPRPGAGPRLSHLRAAFLSSAAGDVRPLIDLVDLCSEIVSLCTDLADLEPKPWLPTSEDLALQRLRECALAVVAFLEPASPLLKPASSPLDPPKPPPEPPPESEFLRFHKHHPALDGLHGVGIFAPFVTNERDLKRLGLSKDGEKPGTGNTPAWSCSRRLPMTGAGIGLSTTCWTRRCRPR